MMLSTWDMEAGLVRVGTTWGPGRSGPAAHPNTGPDLGNGEKSVPETGRRTAAMRFRAICSGPRSDGNVTRRPGMAGVTVLQNDRRAHNTYPEAWPARRPGPGGRQIGAKQPRRPQNSPGRHRPRAPLCKA